MARSGKVMQFLGESRYVANVVDGRRSHIIGVSSRKKSFAGSAISTFMTSMQEAEFALSASHVSPPSASQGLASVKSIPAASNSDRKSTRLNSSHVSISYAVFCLKKKI